MSDPLQQLRDNLAATPEAPADMAPYLEKVRTSAFSITDEDVDAVKRAGISEDEIFEQTVATAIGEGLRRLDAALAVIE